MHSNSVPRGDVKPQPLGLRSAERGEVEKPPGPRLDPGASFFLRAGSRAGEVPPLSPAASAQGANPNIVMMVKPRMKMLRFQVWVGASAKSGTRLHSMITPQVVSPV